MKYKRTRLKLNCDGEQRRKLRRLEPGSLTDRSVEFHRGEMDLPIKNGKVETDRSYRSFIRPSTTISRMHLPAAIW